jgi:hypothetical protein
MLKFFTPPVVALLLMLIAQNVCAQPNNNSLNSLRSALNTCDSFEGSPDPRSAESILRYIAKAKKADASSMDWNGDYYGLKIESIRVSQCEAIASHYILTLPNEEARNLMGSAVRTCIRMQSGSYTSKQLLNGVEEFNTQRQRAIESDSGIATWNGRNQSSVPDNMGLQDFLQQCDQALAATVKQFAEQDASVKAYQKTMVAEHQKRRAQELAAEKARIEKDEEQLADDRLQIYQQNNRHQPTSFIGGDNWYTAKRWTFVTYMNDVSCTKTYEFSADSLQDQQESVGCSLM